MGDNQEIHRPFERLRRLQHLQAEAEAAFNKCPRWRPLLRKRLREERAHYRIAAWNEEDALRNAFTPERRNAVLHAEAMRYGDPPGV